MLNGRGERAGYSPPIGVVFVHSPEDLILYKLLYFSISQQSKHIRDIAAIVRARKNRLEMGYIEQWTKRMGLWMLWKEILADIENAPAS